MRRLLVLIAATTALTGCARLQEAAGELNDVAHGQIGTIPRAPASMPPPTAAPAQQAAAPAVPAAPRVGAAQSAPAPVAAAPAPAPERRSIFTGRARAPQQDVSATDRTVYRQMTLAGLAKTVRDGTLRDGEFIEITAPVDGRFNRQIVIDLRLGDGQAASRRAGDCIQVLLPYFVDQKKFESGRYRIRGAYHKAERDPLFTYEQNRYEPACGTAYIHARWMDAAP